MCSRFHSTSRMRGSPDRRAGISAALLTAALLAGCHHGRGQGMPAEQPDQFGVIDSALTPGVGRSLVSDDPRAAQYYDNADAVVAGKRLFAQYNCNGCHSSGGGGMGADLMDGGWIYGSRLTQIHQTLVEGRPNGMPAWGGKIPDQELWQLATYVRSLSLPATVAAEADDTPGQTPAVVPRAADDGSGWTPPASTTNDYGTTIEGSAYEGGAATPNPSSDQPPKSTAASKNKGPT
jgi:cytochrome c oxidase cbb3-type subunit III